MGVLPACLSVHHLQAWPEEGAGFQEGGGTDNCESPIWVLGIEPMLRSTVLLTTKPSFQAPNPFYLADLLIKNYSQRNFSCSQSFFSTQFEFLVSSISLSGMEPSLISDTTVKENQMKGTALSDLQLCILPQEKAGIQSYSLIKGHVWNVSTE